jgi:hypothetical protein
VIGILDRYVVGTGDRAGRVGLFLGLLSLLVRLLRLSRRLKIAK